MNLSCSWRVIDPLSPQHLGRDDRDTKAQHIDAGLLFFRQDSTTENPYKPLTILIPSASLECRFRGGSGRQPGHPGTSRCPQARDTFRQEIPQDGTGVEVEMWLCKARLQIVLHMLEAEMNAHATSTTSMSAKHGEDASLITTNHYRAHDFRVDAGHPFFFGTTACAFGSG